MRRRLAILIIFVGLSTSAAWAQRQTVRSPDVGPDRMVTFRLLAPKATDITLSGVTLGPIEPEIYHYNFTIDGVRTIDPNNPERQDGIDSEHRRQHSGSQGRSAQLL
jgi:enterochelin esterase family protein